MPVKKFLLILTIFLLFTSPLFAEMKPLVEEELSDIYGTGLLNFSVEHRSVKTTNRLLLPDGYVNHDVAVIEIGTELDLYATVDSLKLGYYDNGWDVDITDLTAGKSKDRPLSLDGLKIEVAFDDINSPDRKLLFIKAGSDDIDGNLNGDFHSLNVDGKVNVLLLLPILLNARRTGLGGLLNSIEFNHTDFWVAFANQITDTSGAVNTNAFLPRTKDTIPGMGAWLHFSEAAGYLLH